MDGKRTNISQMMEQMKIEIMSELIIELIDRQMNKLMRYYLKGINFREDYISRISLGFPKIREIKSSRKLSFFRHNFPLFSKNYTY